VLGESMPKFPLDKCSVRYKRLTDGVQRESFARGDAMRMAVILIALMCAGAGPATRPNELAALRAEPESLALGRWRTARAAAPVALQHRFNFLIARQR
jgi:hypothetical protein